MDKEKVMEWMDKIVEAKAVIDENVFMAKDIKYDGPTICNCEYIQLMSGGWLKKIAEVLDLEIVTKTHDDGYKECSFIYKGIVFLSLEKQVM